MRLDIDISLADDQIELITGILADLVKKETKRAVRPLRDRIAELEQDLQELKK